MEFRPCIDIHNGKVKQIVGGSLADQGNQAKENYVSEYDAKYYANLYHSLGISGGHVILLNAKDSEFYEATKAQALAALSEWPGGLQVGGGITPDNAKEFLDAGASYVVVTSYLIEDKKISFNRLKKLAEAVGKEHLVLDLSCIRGEKPGEYFVVTNRWQDVTDSRMTPELLKQLSEYCDEFLIHAVDVEGKGQGIDGELVKLLGEYEGCPVTYAGGVHNEEDLHLIKTLGKNKVNVTIGSALDLFGGKLVFEEVLQYIREQKIQKKNQSWIGSFSNHLTNIANSK